MSSSTGRLGVAAGSVFSSRMVGTVLRFGVQVLLARWLGSTAYGRFVIVRGWGELLAKVPNRGLELTAVRELPVHQAMGNDAARHRFVRSAERSTAQYAILLATVVAGIVIAFGLFDRLWLVGITIIVTQALATLFLSMQQGLGRLVHATTVTELVQPICFITILLALFTFDSLGPTSAMVALAISIGVGALLQRRNVQSLDNEAAAERAVDSSSSLASPSDSIRSNETWELFASQLSIAFVNLSGVLIVGAIDGATAAALFAVAARVANPSRLASSAVEALVSGQLGATRVLQGSEAQQERQQIVDRAIRLSAGPAIVFLVGGVALSGFVLKIFGSDFAVARTAVIVLLASHAFEAATGPCGYLMSSCGSTRNYAKILVLHALIAAPLMIVLTLSWGVTGAAVSQLLVTVSTNVSLVVSNKRSFDVLCLPRVSVANS